MFEIIVIGLVIIGIFILVRSILNSLFPKFNNHNGWGE